MKKSSFVIIAAVLVSFNARSEELKKGSFQKMSCLKTMVGRNGESQSEKYGFEVRVTDYDADTKKYSVDMIFTGADGSYNGTAKIAGTEAELSEQRKWTPQKAQEFLDQCKPEFKASIKVLGKTYDSCRFTSHYSERQLVTDFVTPAIPFGFTKTDVYGCEDKAPYSCEAGFGIFQCVTSSFGW